MNKLWLALGAGAAVVAVALVLVLSDGDRPAPPAETPRPAETPKSSMPSVPALPANLPPSWRTGTAVEPIRPPADGAPVPPAAMRPVDPADAVFIPESPYKVFPGELLAVLKPGSDRAGFEASLAGLPVQVVGYVPGFRVAQLQVPAARREALRRELEANPLVDMVVHHALQAAKAKFNDPVFGNAEPLDDWGLKAIGAEAAWDISRGEPEVVIAIIDHGTLLTHEELKGKIVRPVSIGIIGDEKPGTPKGSAKTLTHGTHVAATAAGTGDNGVGSSGACPGCSIMPIQAFTSFAMATAVEYAIRNQAWVINISMGFEIDDEADWRDPDAWRRIAEARDREFGYFNHIFEIAAKSGATVIVSAGNDGQPGAIEPMCLSAFSTCVGNAMLNDTGEIEPSPDTNYGLNVPVSAPGDRIYNAIALPGGASYDYLSGTSMASPAVAGLAGLVLSANPKLAPWQVAQVIRASARERSPATGGTGPILAPGLIDTWRQVNAYRRAFLRLLGKDQDLLLDGEARHYLASIIPHASNRVWRTKGTRAMGALIDAPAALKLAASGGYAARFASFTEPEIEAAGNIDPTTLDRLADMLLFAGSYPTSAETGGAFQLTAAAAHDRLTVARAASPGAGYREELIFIAPGRYHHRAGLAGKDYSRGEVSLAWSQGRLTITDKVRGMAVTHRAVTHRVGIEANTENAAFCPVAGGCQANAMGALHARAQDGNGVAVAGPVLIYPAGLARVKANLVASGETNRDLVVPPGTYDVTVAVAPPAVMEKVAVTGGQTRVLEIARTGTVYVEQLDPDGKPLKLVVTVKRSGFLGKGDSNRPLRLGPGFYDIGVTLDESDSGRWWSDVEVVAGRDVRLAAPRPGHLAIDRASLNQDSCDWVLAVPSGGTERFLGCAQNLSKSLWPGRYDIQVRRGGGSEPPEWFPGVVIKAGAATPLSFAKRGGLVARLTLADGTPLAAGITVHAAAAEASVAEPSVAEPSITEPGLTEPGHTEPGHTEGVSNRPLTLAAGTYEVRLVLAPEVAVPATVRAGETAEAVLPAMGLGALVVRLPGPGGRLLDGRDVDVFRPRDEGQPFARGLTGEAVALLPGRYDAVVHVEPLPSLRRMSSGRVQKLGIAVARGKLARVDLDGWGALKVTGSRLDGRKGPPETRLMLFRQGRKPATCGALKMAVSATLMMTPAARAEAALPPGPYRAIIRHEAGGGAGRAARSYCLAEVLTVTGGETVDLKLVETPGTPGAGLKLNLAGKAQKLVPQN